MGVWVGVGLAKTSLLLGRLLWVRGMEGAPFPHPCPRPDWACPQQPVWVRSSPELEGVLLSSSRHLRAPGVG